MSKITIDKETLKMIRHAISETKKEKKQKKNELFAEATEIYKDIWIDLMSDYINTDGRKETYEVFIGDYFVGSETESHRNMLLDIISKSLIEVGFIPSKDTLEKYAIDTNQIINIAKKKKKSRKK